MFGLHRDTVRKMLAYSVPPGYRRQTTPRHPNLLRQAQEEPFTGVIDRILETITRSTGSSATRPSASSSGSGTSTGSTVSTPSSRTTSGSAAASHGRCSCRCLIPPGHAQWGVDDAENPGHVRRVAGDFKVGNPMPLLPRLHSNPAARLSSHLRIRDQLSCLSEADEMVDPPIQQAGQLFVRLSRIPGARILSRG